MKKYYLLKYEENWADEMDIDGYKVLTEKEKIEFEKNVHKIQSEEIEVNFCIGSNEDILYNEEDEDDENCLRVDNAYEITEITETEYSILNKLDMTDIGFASSFVETINDAIED